jgi:hypothetical protein
VTGRDIARPGFANTVIFATAFERLKFGVSACKCAGNLGNEFGRCSGLYQSRQ